jgi:hypothetical protein
MKLFCIKTEETGKYLVKNIFEDNIEILIGENGTSIELDGTKVFILDMRLNNAEVFIFNKEIPLDFEPAEYFYHKETETWEKVPEIILPEPEPEPELIIEDELETVDQTLTTDGNPTP